MGMFLRVAGHVAEIRDIVKEFIGREVGKLGSLGEDGLRKVWFDVESNLTLAAFLGLSCELLEVNGGVEVKGLVGMVGMVLEG